MKDPKVLLPSAILVVSSVVILVQEKITWSKTDKKFNQEYHKAFFRS